MKTSAHNTLRQATCISLLGIGLFFLPVQFRISAIHPPVSPKSQRLHKRADIAVQPVYSLVVREDMPSPVIGVAARVNLQNLKLDIATDHQPPDTPCYEDTCAPNAGFFYDPVYPVYNPGSPEKSWYGKYPMQLMINTSYFKVCSKNNYHKAKCANGSGLLIRGGRRLLGETVRDDQGKFLDAIIFWKDGRAELFFNKDIPKDLSHAEVALGGNWFFSGEEYHCNGCHNADTRQPRTALGLDEGNRTLTIVVIQPGHAARNESLTGRELQFVMRQMGVTRGLMLDGGGSSQFVYVRGDGESVWTVPPGDREGYRPVPSAFGIAGLKDAAN